MITIKPIPLAAASATSAQYLVECEETLCRPYCTGDDAPISSVSFTTGAVSVINGIARVPLLTTIVVTRPSTCGGNCCTSQTFIEQAIVPFIATDTNTITLVAGASSVTEAARVKGCKAQAVKVSNSVTISIS